MLDNSELLKNARNVVIVFNNSNYKTKLVKIANDRFLLDAVHCYVWGRGSFDPGNPESLLTFIISKDFD